MAEENIRTTLQFQADITDFKAAMQEANRAVKLANSEFKAASSGMDDWGSSTDGLAAKLRQLGDVHDAEKRKLDVLQAAYQQAVAEQGAASAAAVDLQTKINNQQAVVNKTQKELDAYAAKLEEVERGADDAASDVKKAGDAAKEAGDDAKDGADGWSIMKDVIADFVSNAVQGAIDALANLAENTREYRRDMAQLAQNASDAAQPMGKMKEVLADVAAVTGETDAAMEGLNMLMATGLDTTNLTNAAEAFAGAATKFDGLKFEGLAEGLQESLAVGEAVGPFAELIERMGGDLEAFNEGMAACTTQAERQQYAMQWLNESGLKEVHDSYVQNNADLVEAEKAQFRHNDAMAKLGAVIEPVNTALANLGAVILEKITPVVESIVNWTMENLPAIAPLIAGIAAALGVLAAALAIQGIISGVSKAFALLNTTMLANPIVLIVAAIAGLVAAFVALWNNCEEFRNFWIGLWEQVKGVVQPVWDAIVSYFKMAWENIKVIWDVAVSYFTTLWENIKLIFGVVKDVLSGNFGDAWEKIKQIFANWGEFFAGLWDGVKNIFGNVGNWFSERFTQAKDLAQKAWSGVKDWFGNVRQGINEKFEDMGNWFSKKFTQAKDLAQKAWSGVKDYFGKVKDGVTGAFSKFDSWMGSKFGDAWTQAKKKFASSTVGQYFGQIGNSIKGVFSAVKSALTGNFSDAWASIKGVFSGWGSFFTGLWDKAKSAFANAGSSMLSIGKNIVQGLWNGISNSFQWIKDKISGWVGNVMDFIKRLFGIHSPSTVMRDQVGKMLGLGMAEGIEDSRNAVNGAVRKLGDAAMGGLSAAGGGASGGSVGGRTIVFNQTNNSPRALSRREIYRQTHNALAFAGGV